MWLRTKKCGSGVIHESKNSGGISRSRKRSERTIMPALPGISIPGASAAHEDHGNIAATAPAEVPAINSLREIMLCSLPRNRFKPIIQCDRRHTRPGRRSDCRTSLRASSERINQVELHALEIGLLFARRNSRRQNCVLQIAVQGAPDPEGCNWPRYWTVSSTRHKYGFEGCWKERAVSLSRKDEIAASCS